MTRKKEVLPTELGPVIIIDFPIVSTTNNKEYRIMKKLHSPPQRLNTNLQEHLYSFQTQDNHCQELQYQPLPN